MVWGWGFVVWGGQGQGVGGWWRVGENRGGGRLGAERAGGGWLQENWLALGMQKLNLRRFLSLFCMTKSGSGKYRDLRKGL